MRPTRFQLYSFLVGGLLFGLVLIESAEGQRGPRGQDATGGTRQGGGAPGGGRQGGAFPGGGAPGGGFPGGQGRGNGGGGAFDPNTIFNMLAPGSDFVAIDTVIQRFSARDPNAAEGVNSFVQRNGITNGVLTREQFALLLQERMAQRTTGGGTGQGGGRRGTPMSTDAIKEWFDRLDVNKDGVLQPEEMPADLKANLKDWDKDGNGTISLEEFTAYAQRVSNRNGGQGGYYDGDEEPVEEDKRQLVYRANNLPKELPPWFGQMDADKDGQVSLFEWKKAGRSVEDFLKYDMNGDGFLTIDEVLRYEARNKPAAGSAADAFAFADAGTGQRGFGPGGQGGNNGRNFGPGGQGGNNGRNFGPGGQGGNNGRNFGPGGQGGNSGRSRDTNGGTGRNMRQPGGEEE